MTPRGRIATGAVAIAGNVALMVYDAEPPWLAAVFGLMGVASILSGVRGRRA